MIILSKKHIISLHDSLIKQSGGLEGVRDDTLLDSALQTPFQTFAGEELYPTVPKKAACLCFGLVKNHAFHDGNKRIGILAMMTFMELNGMEIFCTNEELIEFGLGIASGKIGQEQILNWIIVHNNQ